MVAVPRGVRASFLVVSRDSAPVLAAGLPSLQAARARLGAAGFANELLLADNRSDDGSAELAARLAPDAFVLRLKRNLGYGAALNRAAQLARGEWLVACNADLLVPPGGLDALPAVLARQPGDVAVVGPALLDGDGSPQPSVGRWPTLAGLLAGLLRPAARRRALAADAGAGRPAPWVSGACLAVRAAAFGQAGGFDEGFFLYYEEVDLARRLAARGYSCRFEPELRVVHGAPLHARERDAELLAVVAASRRRYFARHRPAWEARALGLLERAERRLRAPPGGAEGLS
jgi:N-acetylglucosaminyl-diphospho-decaprenol L-rhamnosyltransferase